MGRPVSPTPPPPNGTGLARDRWRRRLGLPLSTLTLQKAAFWPQACLNCSSVMAGCFPFSHEEQQTPLASCAGSAKTTLCQSLLMAVLMECTTVAATEVAVTGIPLRLDLALLLSAAMVAILSWSQVDCSCGGGCQADWSSASNTEAVQGGLSSDPR